MGNDGSTLDASQITVEPPEEGKGASSANSLATPSVDGPAFGSSRRRRSIQPPGPEEGEGPALTAPHPPAEPRPSRPASRRNSEEDLKHPRGSTIGDRPAGTPPPAEELARMHEALGYSKLALELSNEYISTVMSAASREDSTRCRSFDYAFEKLRDSLAWRAENAPQVADEAVQKSLSRNWLYWHGVDNQRRPILWIRASEKDWSEEADAEAEFRAHLFLLEGGLRLMGPGVTTFVAISCASGVSFNQLRSFLPLVSKLQAVLVKAYPDRLHGIYTGPTSVILTSLYPLLKPVLPASITGKINLLRDPRHDLLALIEPDLLPDFFGGEKAHHGNKEPAEVV